MYTYFTWIYFYLLTVNGKQGTEGEHFLTIHLDFQEDILQGLIK